MQKQKNGHTGLLPNVTVIPFFPLEDVWIMVFELSLIRFAFRGGLFYVSYDFPCISLPQRGQVMTMRPFPLGTRHTAPQPGQVK